MINIKGHTDVVQAKQVTAEVICSSIFLASFPAPLSSSSGHSMEISLQSTAPEQGMGLPQTPYPMCPKNKWQPVQHCWLGVNCNPCQILIQKHPHSSSTETKKYQISSPNTMQVQIEIDVHVSTQLQGVPTVILVRVSTDTLSDKQFFLIKWRIVLQHLTGKVHTGVHTWHVPQNKC